MSRDQLFILEKQLEWVCKLGGAESLRISKVGQTVFSRLMESQIWHQPASSVAVQGESSEKGQWPLLTLMPDTSASPNMPLGALQAATLVVELRVSPSE